MMFAYKKEGRKEGKKEEGERGRKEGREEGRKTFLPGMNFQVCIGFGCSYMPAVYHFTWLRTKILGFYVLTRTQF